MDSLFSGSLLIGLGVALALVGLVMVRRAVPLSFLETHHEVGGFFLGLIGAIYGVLLAFVVFVVWDNFEEAKVTVAREANQLGDIVRMAQGLPAPIRQQVRAGALDYARVVADDEWPMMARGEASPQAQQAMHALWQLCVELEPATARESALYEATLDRLNELSDTRRVRLEASHHGLPRAMWILLWGGALITLAFTYFFGVKSLRSQALMTGALALLLGFVLFLIAAIDRPFVGLVHVTPEPFQHLISTLPDATPALPSFPPAVGSKP